jgi:hypothetical protein
VLCRAGSRPPCYSAHVLPVVFVPVCGVIVTCCLDCVLVFIISGVVKLLSSSPSCLLTPKNKKKKFACCRNDGDVTYGIRRSTHDLVAFTVNSRRSNF